MFMTNDSMAFFEMMDAISDGMYTDNYVEIEICNVCDGNFGKIASNAECVLATTLLKLILHRNQKSCACKLNVTQCFVVAATYLETLIITYCPRRRPILTRDASRALPLITS